MDVLQKEKQRLQQEVESLKATGAVPTPVLKTPTDVPSDSTPTDTPKEDAAPPPPPLIPAENAIDAPAPPPLFGELLFSVVDLNVVYRCSTSSSPLW